MKQEIIGLELVMDVKTRWNSTYLMINSDIHLKCYLQWFKDYLTTSSGKVDFPNSERN